MQIQKSKQGYKRTSVGEIPEEWKVRKLEELAYLQAGGTPSRFKNEYWENGTIPWLSSGEVRNNIVNSSSEKITELGLSKSAARLFPKGTVLIAITGQGLTRGRTALLGIDCTTNQSIVGIMPNVSLINNVFLWYYLQNQYWKLRNISQGSNQAGLNLELLNTYSISVPTLPEQEKIASILSKVDELIQETDQVIEQTRRLKNGLIQRLLTKGIGHTKFKKVKYVFGRSIEIPENWKVVKVNDITQSIVPGRNKPRRFVGDIPWITISDLDRMYVYDSKNGLRITKEEVKQNAGKIIPPQSVIMTCVGEFGKVGIALREMVLNQQLHAFICSEYILPYFLAISLMLQKEYMYSIATTTTIPYMNKDNCESIPVILPPVSEQEKVISTLSSLESKITKDQNCRRGIEKIKNGLMQKLLTGKIRVKA